MWYSDIKKDYVEFYLNNQKIIYPILNCRYIDFYNNTIYFLTDSEIFAYKDKQLIFKKATIEKYCEKIIVRDYIYVSGNDSGTIYKYNLYGDIIESIKIGEHISDFKINDNIYVLSYFDYKITLLSNFKIKKVIYFSKYPENIIVKNNVYVLMRSEHDLFIYMFNKKLVFLRKIRLKGQIAKLKLFDNKIIFDGDEDRIIFNENLTVLSHKKSTGINLCDLSNYPVCYNKQYLDIYNNTIYPL